MIPVTDEMRAAFRAERDDWCDEIGCGRDDCLTERLAAVLAIVERDYEPRRCDNPSALWHRCTKPRGHDGGHQHRFSGVAWP